MLCWIYVPICFTNTITAMYTLYQYTSHMTLCNLINNKKKEDKTNLFSSMIFVDKQVWKKMKNPKRKTLPIYITKHITKTIFSTNIIWMKVMKKFSFFINMCYVARCGTQCLQEFLWLFFSFTFDIWKYVQDNICKGIFWRTNIQSVRK